jgi:DNA-binding NtrC family response regulator
VNTPAYSTSTEQRPGSRVVPETQKPRLLVVDDSEDTRTGLAELIESWGYETRTASSGEEALLLMKDLPFHLCISDLMMPPGISGMDLMGMAHERHPETAFILLTGHGTIENATQAMREGAYDYLTKPVDLRRLKIVIEKALEQVDVREEVQKLRQDLAERGKFGSMVGRSPAMLQVYRVVSQAAPSRASVLITGESGTGKEIVARTLHEMSPRRAKPFVAVNCAAIPDTLLESEIFGHEKGSFTGAMNARAGCFELADGGTLLLDEIGEMSPELQAKLLRVLEERTLRRVGGRQEFAVDVRVISSTNIDIATALNRGSFREDLYYRLNVFTIHLPALRDRGEDVPLLAQHFLDEFAKANNRVLSGFTPAAQELLKSHDWPGNVRELRNALERAVIVAPGPGIDVADLPNMNLRNSPAAASPLAATAAPLPVQSVEEPRPIDGVVLTVGTTVEEAEKRLILETLKHTNDNKTRAAEVLGISTKTLHNKLKKYGRSTDPE